jgi:hypothetical protein
VKFLNVEDESDDVLTINKRVMLTLQTHILDDVATILGYRDKAIKGTEEDPDGSAYPDDVEKYLLDTYHYVSDNLFYIETLLHQRCTQGIIPGHYKCNDAIMLWEYVTD